MKRFILLIVVLFCVAANNYGQVTNKRIESLRLRLESLSDDVPQLNNKVTFSVSGISLFEFLRALANNNKININVDPSMNNNIAVNFTNVTVRDLLVYLCDEYNLELYTTGEIISVVKYIQPVVVDPPPVQHIPNVSYSKNDKLLSFDLKLDTLSLVTKKISELTNVNVLIPQSLTSKLITGYIKNMKIDRALSELAYMNNLSYSKKDSLTYYLEDITNKTSAAKESQLATPNGLQLKTNNRDSILSIQASNVPIKDILSAVAGQLNINYFVFTEIKGATDLRIESVDFNTFLRYLFNATDYTYKYNNGIYLIGDRKQEEIRTFDVYNFKYRTVNKIIEQIPADFKKGVEIIPLPELNSVVIAGSGPAVRDLMSFLLQIDKTVPVVNIELIVLDIRRSANTSTGIMAGIDNAKTTSTYSSVFPNIDMTLSANSINTLIDGINGIGLVNLGKVTPGFYVSLKASEDNGDLKVKSTPRLATLNGNEAKMTIGETRYYAEQTTNVITTQSTTTVTGVVYKELQANFTVNIKPVVSGDEQITLDIDLEQSTFTEQVTKNGPYGRLTRSFKSSLRVKNDDMILLGGLDEKSSNDAGQGVPLLSRIPIIKWIFSSRSSSTKKSKLAILIHPTVFY